MRENYEEVEGIPSGILTCFIDGNEVGVTKCSPTSIAIRVPDQIKQVRKMEIAGYCFRENQYHYIVVREYTQEEEQKEEYCWIYHYEINDDEYAAEIRRIQKEYMSYIRYKMEYDDSIVSQELTGYPAQQDEVVRLCGEDILTDWLQQDDWNAFFERKLSVLKANDIEVAVTLDTPAKYHNFVSLGISGIGMENMPDSLRKHIKRVYIGNQFCPNLFPDRKLLFDLLVCAWQNGLAVTVCLSYLRDNKVEEMQKLLMELAAWCRDRGMQLEMVCNDVGYLLLLEPNKDVFQPNLGILLNKRRKDPRYPYKKGFRNRCDDFMDNAWNSSGLEQFAANYGIQRYEYESCGYKMHIAEGTHSLHMPLYQTNTATYCTLYASSMQGERGRQKLVEHCRYPCEQYVFSYPRHLKMIGKYNSLFGYDNSLLQNKNWLDEYLKQGINRLVWNL